MAAEFTRRKVIKTVRDLFKIGLLNQVRPALLLLPAFQKVLGQQVSRHQSSTQPDIYGSSDSNLAQMGLQTISNYLQTTIDAVNKTSADLAALPLAITSPETVGQYLNRLQAGDPLVKFTVIPDVGGSIGRIGDLSINTSRGLDLSVTYAYGPFRYGLDQALNSTVGVNLPGVNLMTSPSELLSGTLSIRASSSLPPIRGTLSITVEPAQGFYNIGGGMVRDFYNAILSTSGSPYRLTTSGWIMR